MHSPLLKQTCAGKTLKSNIYPQKAKSRSSDRLFALGLWLLAVQGFPFGAAEKRRSPGRVRSTLQELTRDACLNGA